MRKAIVAISDINYLEYASYLFRKIRKFDIEDSLYLLTDGVTQEEYDAHFGEIENCFLVQCDEKIENLKFSANRHVTRATFIKLLVPELIPNHVELVLYLDVDIFLSRSIKPILDFPLREIIGATQFANGESEILHGHSNHSYFSAGVLLINATKWRNANIGRKCLDVLEGSTNNFFYQDMDVLNLVFLEAWQVMPPSFNFMNQPELNYVANTKKIEPIIIHFPGPLKPWKKEANSKMARAWREDYISMGYELEMNNSDKIVIRFLLRYFDSRLIKFGIKRVFGKKLFESVKKWLSKS